MKDRYPYLLGKTNIKEIPSEFGEDSRWITYDDNTRLNQPKIEEQSPVENQPAIITEQPPTSPKKETEQAVNVSSQGSPPSSYSYPTSTSYSTTPSSAIELNLNIPKEVSYKPYGEQYALNIDQTKMKILNELYPKVLEQINTFKSRGLKAYYLMRAIESMDKYLSSESERGYKDMLTKAGVTHNWTEGALMNFDPVTGTWRSITPYMKPTALQIKELETEQLKTTNEAKVREEEIKAQLQKDLKKMEVTGNILQKYLDVYGNTGVYIEDKLVPVSEVIKNILDPNSSSEMLPVEQWKTEEVTVGKEKVVRAYPTYKVKNPKTGEETLHFINIPMPLEDIKSSLKQKNTKK